MMHWGLPAFAKAIVALQCPMLKRPTASLYPCRTFSSGDSAAAALGPFSPADAQAPTAQACLLPSSPLPLCRRQ